MVLRWTVICVKFFTKPTITIRQSHQHFVIWFLQENQHFSFSAELTCIFLLPETNILMEFHFSNNWVWNLSCNDEFLPSGEQRFWSHNLWWYLVQKVRKKIWNLHSKELFKFSNINGMVFSQVNWRDYKEWSAKEFMSLSEKSGNLMIILL